MDFSLVLCNSASVANTGLSSHIEQTRANNLCDLRTWPPRFWLLAEDTEHDVSGHSNGLGVVSCPLHDGRRRKVRKRLKPAEESEANHKLALIQSEWRLLFPVRRSYLPPSFQSTSFTDALVEEIPIPISFALPICWMMREDPLILSFHTEWTIRGIRGGERKRMDINWNTLNYTRCIYIHKTIYNTKSVYRII